MSLESSAKVGRFVPKEAVRVWAIQAVGYVERVRDEITEQADAAKIKADPIASREIEAFRRFALKLLSRATPRGPVTVEAESYFTEGYGRRLGLRVELYQFERGRRTWRGLVSTVPKMMLRRLFPKSPKSAA